MKRKVGDCRLDSDYLQEKDHQSLPLDELFSFDWSDLHDSSGSFQTFSHESADFSGTSFPLALDELDDVKNLLVQDQEPLSIAIDPLLLPSISDGPIPVPLLAADSTFPDDHNKKSEKGMHGLCDKFFQHFNGKDHHDFSFNLENLAQQIQIRSRRFKELLKLLEIFQVVSLSFPFFLSFFPFNKIKLWFCTVGYQSQ